VFADEQGNRPFNVRAPKPPLRWTCGTGCVWISRTPKRFKPSCSSCCYGMIAKKGDSPIWFTWARSRSSHA